ncbi:ATP-binding cassette domain-containing protein [Gramella sp. AN32]|uniref:ATP-binding cassette domain-containing protein n=1 Tax=Christiangramia antarctica TaxID=2058158 RepID=A0ABW5X3H8_9FLAO|nr:ATP-binding cassette domain-containing protein [Gramella sp. AN32]MCM4157707.1 ABC transporter [Gramella sp. AN32]
MARNKYRHFAVSIENNAEKAFFNQIKKGNFPGELACFRNKKIGIFSEEVLKEYIEEDYKHGRSQLSQDRSIRTFSTGERRKALLEHLINQQIEVLLLVNPFDALDIPSGEFLQKHLVQLSEDISIIQLIKRKEDLLPFIDEVLLIGKNQVYARVTAGDFKKDGRQVFEKDVSIPPPLKKYDSIPEELVKLKGVSVFYEDRPILKNINWTVKKGEFWQLSGPNGSGKTTILSMIYGDNPKAYGQDLYLFGNKKGSGETVWEIKDKIGYFSPALTEMFQGNHSLENMLISGMLDSIGLYAMPKKSQISLAEKWLKVLGFPEKANILFSKASALEQRLVLIGRAMIKHPPLLILDEPTTGLNDEAAALLVELINKIASESETAVIYVSHRKESGLNPQFIFQLTKRQEGSTGGKV